MSGLQPPEAYAAAPSAELGIPPPNSGTMSRAMSSPAIASSDTSDPSTFAKPVLQQLLQRLPQQYALATSFNDRMIHAKLLAELQASTDATQTVRLEWAQNSQAPNVFSLWLVFADRRGSLGLITSVLAELNVNIGKASVFSTSDGIAVDSFSVDRMDVGLAQTLRSRLTQALCSPWAAEAVTDWSSLSLGAVSSTPSSAVIGGAPGGVPPGFAPPGFNSVPGTPPRTPTLPVTPAQIHPPSAADHSMAVEVSEPYPPPQPAPARQPKMPDMLPAEVTNSLTEEELTTLHQLQGQFSNLLVRKLIDEGASSQVWEGDWAGARVVIKVLREQEALRSFLSEVNIWRQLRHPCVCALLGVCMFDARPSMVLEYMTGGSLHDLLHNPSEGALVEIEPLLLARVVAEVSSGVAYLHANGVMHRDIKTANVLLDDARHAKVTDFGISTRFGRKDYTAETGTYRQMAPEVILHKPYNYKCDVYSYGVLLWETLHREVPFTGFAPLQAAFAVAMEHQRPPIHLRPEYKMYATLIEACWDGEPHARPDMDQVVRATAECYQMLEQGLLAAQQPKVKEIAAVSTQQQQGSPPPSTGGAEGAAPETARGLRGLTGAIASRLSISGRKQ